MHQILPILEQVAGTGRPLLLLADDFDEEVMQLLITNHLRGTLQCVAVKAPGVSNRRTSLLEDIAVVTGGRAITRDLGLTLDRVHINDLGQASRIVVGSDSTTIFGAAGSPEQVRERVELLRREVTRTHDPIVRERLQQRLSNMAGRFATVHVARPTPAEADDAKYRAQSAMHSMRVAIEGGFTLGGGLGLIKAGSRLATVKWPSESEKAGAEAVALALRAPAAALAEAAGLRMIDPGESNSGINVETGDTTDLLDSGVLDPVRMLRVALETAYSQAKILLLTDGGYTTQSGESMEYNDTKTTQELFRDVETLDDELPF